MAIVTWNPSDKGSSITLSNNNLTASTSSTSSSSVRANYAIPKGKWYWEVYYPTTYYQLVGVATNTVTNMDMSGLTTRTGIRAYESYRGIKLNDTVALGTYTTGDTSSNQYIGIAVDTINGTLEFFKNGISQGVSFTDILSLGTIYPFLGLYNSTGTAIANFGASTFAYPNTLKSLGTGWQSLDGNQKNQITKYLIQDKNNILYTHDGISWDKLKGNMSEDIFKNKGMSDITLLNNTNISIHGQYGDSKGALGNGGYYSMPIPNDLLSIKSVDIN